MTAARTITIWQWTSDVKYDSVHMYLKEIGSIKLLSSEEEIRLAKAIEASKMPEATPEEKQEGQRARAKLADANLRLVVSIAKKYRERGLHMLTSCRKAISVC